MKSLSLKKVGAGLIVAVIAYYALDHFGLIPASIKQASAVPTSVSLASADEVPLAPAAGDVAPVPLPSTTLAPTKAPVIRLNAWAWNAQMGLFFANGGPVTTTGSLMAKHGVSLKVTRQDDTEKSKAAQIQLAEAMAAGDANPGVGIHFVTIMGDGAAQYLASFNTATAKLGPDYRAEIVGAVGYSRGEDAWWGPLAWKDSPESMKGGATAAVLRDGDWNLTQYKLANDGIKNNPDATTWDPEAMNWFAADDYLKAVEMYVSGYCEDRPVVRDGRLTSEPKHHICVEGVSTWTPGDVNLAKQKGGLVRLLSTKENAYQMPSVVIGVRKWNVTHQKQVVEFLAAALEGGDQVLHHEAALSRAGQASYAIYAEQSPAYWVKYYKGVVERDKTQQPVPLGGSKVMNLADNLVLFGLAEGAGGLGSSVFKATYEGFGNIVAQQYPRLMPTFPKTEEAVNVSFLQTLASVAPKTEAQLETFEEGTGAPTAKENVVATKNWNIQFETGSASFTPTAAATLQALYNQLVVGSALTIEIDGHTDNVGNPASNQALSNARALAVKTWLETKAPTLFPTGRVTVQAYGDGQPIAPNATADGRAKNRRVVIILGTR